MDADGEVGWAPALFLEPADEMAEVTPNVQTFDIGQGRADLLQQISRHLC